MSYFEELGLAQPILKALSSAGYDTPTPIQSQAIPPLLEGRDLCGVAQTGTGKTAAFALPSLHYFAQNIQPRRAKSCRMLVLSPTRELAAQIADNFRIYGKYMGLTVQCVFGGKPVFTQKKKLAGGTDILVATPGRLLDLIDQRALTLDDVEIFVLDEADQMMDLGFIHALKRIDALLPKKRQSLFFSATMPKKIAELGNKFLHDPVRVSVTPQSTTAERVMQYATFVNQKEKQALLNHKLQNEDIELALIFTRTKHGADRVVRHLAGAGIEARAIHGNKSQGQRTQAMQDFRSGRVKILVATDIAARGIDVPGVSHVFNFELPNVPEQYVHRIGRTARAGTEGVAISFVADDERAYLKDIERLTKIRLKNEKLPEGFREMVANLPKPERPPRSEQQSRHGGRGRPQRGSAGGRGRPQRGSAGEGRQFEKRKHGGNSAAYEARETMKSRNKGGEQKQEQARDKQRDQKQGSKREGSRDGSREKGQNEGRRDMRGRDGQNESRPKQNKHKRGGPPTAKREGGDGKKQRNYGPKKGSHNRSGKPGQKRSGKAGGRQDGGEGNRQGHRAGNQKGNRQGNQQRNQQGGNFKSRKGAKA